MANAAGAQHALEAPRRSRHHGGEAIVTRSEPMRWGRVRGVGAVQAAGASMMDRACDALNGLSAERQRTVEFMARLGAVGADFMQQADMQDAAEQDALQDQARDILRREGRRRRQIHRRSRNSEAKSARAGRDQSEPVHRSREDQAEPVHRAPDVAEREKDQSPENAGVDSMSPTLPSRTSGWTPQ